MGPMLALRRARRESGDVRARAADTRRMTDHVYKSLEITGSSPDGVTQAIQRAVAKASQTLRHLDWFEVLKTRGVIGEDGRIGHYR
jgi:flavin-binding protein dodecin